MSIEEAVMPTLAQLSEDRYRIVHQEQVAKGLKEYGRPLSTFNGRSAADDCRREMADALDYLTQLEVEYEQVLGERDRLKDERDHLAAEGERLRGILRLLSHVTRELSELSLPSLVAHPQPKVPLPAAWTDVLTRAGAASTTGPEVEVLIHALPILPLRQSQEPSIPLLEAGAAPPVETIPLPEASPTEQEPMQKPAAKSKKPAPEKRVQADPHVVEGISATELGYRAGVSVGLIHAYQNQGLIAPLPGTGVSTANPRRFDPSLVDTLKLIRARRAREKTERFNNNRRPQSTPPAPGHLPTSIPTGFLSSTEVARQAGLNPNTIAQIVREGILVAAGQYLYNGRPFGYYRPEDALGLAERVQAHRASLNSQRALKNPSSALTTAPPTSNTAPPATQSVPTVREEKPEKSTKPEKSVKALADEEADGEEDALGLAPLERAAKHPYHWTRALDVVQAAVEASEGDHPESPPPFDVAFRDGVGYEIVAAGGVTADLVPFARLHREMSSSPGQKGAWTMTLSPRSGWLRPMAIKTREAWQKRETARRSTRTGP